MDDKFGLRPCKVVTVVKGKRRTVNAYFHLWCQKSDIYEPSPMIGGHPGGTIQHTMGLVEYEDGTIHEEYPINIKFIDREID